MDNNFANVDLSDLFLIFGFPAGLGLESKISDAIASHSPQEIFNLLENAKRLPPVARVNLVCYVENNLSDFEAFSGVAELLIVVREMTPEYIPLDDSLDGPLIVIE